jgi:hypothetical protein
MCLAKNKPLIRYDIFLDHKTCMKCSVAMKCMLALHSSFYGCSIEKKKLLKLFPRHIKSGCFIEDGGEINFFLKLILFSF